MCRQTAVFNLKGSVKKHQLSIYLFDNEVQISRITESEVQNYLNKDNENTPQCPTTTQVKRRLQPE